MKTFTVLKHQPAIVTHYYTVQAEDSKDALRQVAQKLVEPEEYEVVGTDEEEYYDILQELLN